jgi:hypothetical protein
MKKQNLKSKVLSNRILIYQRISGVRDRTDSLNLRISISTHVIISSL